MTPGRIPLQEEGSGRTFCPARSGAFRRALRRGPGEGRSTSCTGRKGAPGEIRRRISAASRHRSIEGTATQAPHVRGLFRRRCRTVPGLLRSAVRPAPSFAVLFSCSPQNGPAPRGIRRPKSGLTRPVRDFTKRENLSTRRFLPRSACARRGSFFHASCPQGTWVSERQKAGFPA